MVRIFYGVFAIHFLRFSKKKENYFETTDAIFCSGVLLYRNYCFFRLKAYSQKFVFKNAQYYKELGQLADCSSSLQQ